MGQANGFKQAAKCKVVHILFETFRPLKGDVITIIARRKPLQQLQKEISAAVPAGTSLFASTK
jgi:hypothetical protein